MTHEQLRDALRDAHETMHKVLGVFPSNDTGCEDLSRAMKKCREALAALDREVAGVSLPADRVQIPENRKQAEAMVVIGQAWLDQNKVATPPAADMHYTHDSTRLFMSTAQRPAAESDVEHSADGNSVSYSGDGTARRKLSLPKNWRPGDQLVIRQVQHPPAAERDVSGWAPELREIAAAIPQSVHDEVAREAAAEREGAGKPEPNDGEPDGMLALAMGVAEQRWPHTTDARAWARQWMEHIAKTPTIPTCEETMAGWFANAIMAGYDTATMRAQAADALDAARRDCDWTYDDADDFWKTKCGNAHQFTADGPMENHHLFCPYCGGNLVIALDAAQQTPTRGVPK